MLNNLLKSTWGLPPVLGILTLFGLLTALLGSSDWYLLSWISMVIPLGAIVWAVGRSRRLKVK